MPPSAFPAPPGHTTRILVAEDDPVSGQYLRTALEQQAAQVTLATHGDEALRLAQTHHFDLLLLDCRMPGAGALEIVQALRAQPRSASHASVAVATSAELDATQKQALRAHGFAASLCKPVPLGVLQQTLDSVLPGRSPALLDDAAACKASGTEATMRALRELFAEELAQLDKDLTALAAEPTRLHARLHRLLASCGLCGATALTLATRDLQQRLGPDEDAAATAGIAVFRQTLEETRHALQAPPNPGNS